MPNIAQQDYIIIDWEGKDAYDDTKRAEVDAQLKNIYLANPLALLSVIFKNYNSSEPQVLAYYPIVSFFAYVSEVTYGLALTDTIIEISFSLT